VRVVTVANQKGGTGKSTLVALIAYGLAAKGYKVLLIDLDPQAHLSSFFVPVNELENVNDGVFELVHGRPFKIRNVMSLNGGRVDLIPSGLNYIMLTYRGVIPSWDPFAIDLALQSLVEEGHAYDFVVCDTAPELFPPTIWGLFAADYILIPTNYEELSLVGVKLLIRNVLPEVMSRSRRNTKVLGVVLTNVVHRITRESVNELGASIARYVRQLPIGRRFYKKPIFDTIVFRFWVLRDLVYRPRRWMIPLYRLIENYLSLKQTVNMLVEELLWRIEHFEPLV